MNWHLLSIKKVSQLLNVSPSGLDQVVASQRLMKQGKNEIRDREKKGVLKMILNQVTDFMIIILLIAAIISGIVGDIVDTVIILIIIVLNAFIGFFQEYKAEKAMAALKKMLPDKASVIRNGNQVDIDAAELVQGDVVSLEAGNIIPADVRFIETNKLKVDEASLTGESFNVEKTVAKLVEKSSALGDRVNMGFKGTFVTNGKGLGYVVATGMNTEIGRIAKMIQSDEMKTPLQRRLDNFGKKLSIFILIVCAVIFVIGWLRGESLLEMLVLSISLAVAAIPEALPALVTITLALGAKKLAKNNALIRKLPAVETLGSVTYICSDKTGTLTENKMIVQEIYETEASLNNMENILLLSIALNNDVYKSEEGELTGDSTEVALVKYAQENKFERLKLETLYPRIDEIPFEAARKCMTTFHKTNEGILQITKGAVDVLLGKLTEAQNSKISDFESKANSLAEKGYRVLGYAARILADTPTKLDAKVLENDLVLIGFAGLIDPPRAEAKKAVHECKSAGIIPVMITGDHKLTASAIATELGLLESREDKVLSGSELKELSEDEFNLIVEQIKVYARVDPEQKLKIVKALQERHHYVAMTGDGINDAPALKNADIGVAMGINGTEVSKEASHLILLDDNFATIVVAVSHGRKIFDNILKFIKYIMTGNSSEIWAIFLAPLFSLPIPLLAIHILWVNLITDGLPGLALASEPAELDLMKRKPRDPKQSIFSEGMAVHILWVGFLMGMVTVGMQAWALYNDNAHWQTMTFTVLCFSQMGHVMAIRSKKESIFKIGVFSNKYLIGALVLTFALQFTIIYVPFFNDIFKTQPLPAYELGITLAVSAFIFWAVELEKWFKRRKASKKRKEENIE